ncbi:hypothetical protein PsorP6_008213 [Peronosclerospora sorghi]|uniref:Uncharacterized protein n=1 Tax=Peronosclerospora sorghi TaxID=230839 RepID=A0ACC0W7E7_9STRA|nr:hypothetical protein PsorP6_008213 [Peronosclerospora sorghi]
MVEVSSSDMVADSPSLRRKPSRKVQLLREDQHGSKDDGNGSALCKKVDPRGTETNEITISDLSIAIIDNPIQSSGSTQVRRNRNKPEPESQKVAAIVVHHLDKQTSAEKKTLMKSLGAGSSRKPVLNVITTNLGDVGKNAPGTPLDGQVGTRRGRPRSTSLHIRECVTGERCTISFEQVEDYFQEARSSNVRGRTSYKDIGAGEDATPLSDYALQKRTSASCLKRVQTGVPGRTPIQQYVFFRDTPPSFVTETFEQAVQVLDALRNDTFRTSKSKR